MQSVPGAFSVGFREDTPKGQLPDEIYFTGSIAAQDERVHVGLGLRLKPMLAYQEIIASETASVSWDIPKKKGEFPTEAILTLEDGRRIHAVIEAQREFLPEEDGLSDEFHAPRLAPHRYTPQIKVEYRVRLYWMEEAAPAAAANTAA